MGQRIVLMTANVQGGIIQFTFQLYHTLKSLGYTFTVCLPYQMHDSNIEEIAPEDRLQYHKEKSVVSMKPYKTIAGQIMATSPDYIWYCDDSAICAHVGRYIQDEKVQQLLTLHDAGGYHPTNHESLRSKILRQYIQWLNRSFYQKVYRFVLLSPECQKVFCDRFPSYSARTVCMTLGAHIPQAKETPPTELADLKDKTYLLFFGRIDKYKGIGNLLRAYKATERSALPLIIAGGGQLSVEEKELFSKAQNVTLINRYIYDGEMKWLIGHSAAVVLPYIEATQSGVIPIAYAYGKPVIVSDVPGLTQVVQDQHTGFIVRNVAELTSVIAKLDKKRASEMHMEVSQYYEQHMDWKCNIGRMFSEL